MKKSIKIAILGGGGRTGKFLVSQLLDQDYQLKLLIRKPEEFKIESPLIEIIEGDACDPEAIQALLEGCQAVINTVGQRKGEPLVASQACLNLLQSMTLYGIKRYLVLAGLNLDTPFDNKSPQTSAATEWMKQTFPVIHADRQQAYSVLSESEVDWTLVRVPLIEFSDQRGQLIADLEDCRGSKISAADIAAFLIQQLSDDTYVRKAPFITNP